LEVEPEELWKRFFARTVLRLALRICTTFSRRVACACRNIEELLLSAVTALVEAVNCDMITELGDSSAKNRVGRTRHYRRRAHKSNE
jgi:hypothetical protein